VELAPGSYSVVNRGTAQIDAFTLFLDRNSGSVKLFEREGAEGLIFTPGAEPEELSTFQVFSPVTWDLPQLPVPVEFTKNPRPDAVPGQREESPGKGKPAGDVPGFGGDLLSGSQLTWLLILGLYLYVNSKGKRS
jgi:hypothetical protein